MGPHRCGSGAATADLPYRSGFFSRCVAPRRLLLPRGGGGGGSLARRGAAALLLSLALLGGGAPAAAAPPFSGEHLDLDDNTVTLGHFHACALERVDEMSVGGEIVCWGDGSRGQLNPPAGLFVQISASEHTTCAVGIDERVACWGGEAAVVAPAAGAAAAAAGAAGGPPPPPPPRAHAAGVAALLHSGPLLQVSLGARHACALGSGSGAVVCWGDDAHGQVSGAPRGAALAQVSCGGDACCGLVRGGEGAAAGGGGGGFPVACWGSDAGGLLASAPAAGSGLLQVSVAGDGHACGVAADYSLLCWGSFVGPTGGTAAWAGTFLQVAASEALTCALRADGTLFCVGEARQLWSGRPVRGRGDLAPPPPPPPKSTQFSEITAQ